MNLKILGMIDISSLEKAHAQLEKSYAFSVSELAESDEEIFELSRLASIQAFEFCYELSIKFMQRALQEMGASGKPVDHLTFYDFIKESKESGLIQDTDKWLDYRSKRNMTSHTYGEESANIVYGILPEFKTDIAALITRLKEL